MSEEYSKHFETNGQRWEMHVNNDDSQKRQRLVYHSNRELVAGTSPQPAVSRTTSINPIKSFDITSSHSSDNEEKSSKKSEKPKFLDKLVEILDDTFFSQYIHWSSDGKSIILNDRSGFVNVVLPAAFSHTNYNSFIRQLNMYGFRKQTSNPEMISYVNSLFQRGRPDLRKNIVRTTTRALREADRKITDQREAMHDALNAIDIMRKDLSNVTLHQEEMLTSIAKVHSVSNELERLHDDLRNKVSMSNSLKILKDESLVLNQYHLKGENEDDHHFQAPASERELFNNRKKNQMDSLATCDKQRCRDSYDSNHTTYEIPNFSTHFSSARPVSLHDQPHVAKDANRSVSMTPPSKRKYNNFLSYQDINDCKKDEKLNMDMEK